MNHQCSKSESNIYHKETFSEILTQIVDCNNNIKSWVNKTTRDENITDHSTPCIALNEIPQVEESL